ncbi:MAG: hypothetical protein EPO68_15130 [Planctomycetota bacterium]|nr:MAG: hypothetical protein EPO68_15130 [Planctomycetota bacterium]
MHESKTAIASLILLGLVLTCAASAPRDEQSPASPAPPPAPEVIGVPVGGVLMWWGMESALPEGFEICDGKFPVAKGALLKERKPDLRDRFAKGARDFASFRPQNALSGGSNSHADVTTTTHALTVNELPKHTHPIAHTHTLAPHDHRIGPHTHAIGEFIDISYGDGGNPTQTQVLTSHSAPAPNTSEPAPQSSATGLSATLTTSAPSAPNSGENAWNTGALQGHAHTVHIGDTLPAFVEMIFVIRVK